MDPASGLDGVLDLWLDGPVIMGTCAPGEGSHEGVQVIEASGCLVVPGLIDMHVHFREPGQEHKEDIASGLRAAAAGGFTSVCPMANTEPPVEDAQGVEYQLSRASETGLGNLFPVGALSKGLKGEVLAAIGEMAGAGARAISDDGSPVNNGELMRRALEYAGIFDLPVLSHAEDSKLRGKGVVHLGPTSLMLGLKGIPAASEVSAVFRDVQLAELTGGRLHLCHLSAKGSVNVVKQAKAGGVNVTAEVTPHHLCLNDEIIREMNYDTNLKVNPPLRSEADRQALIEALADGTIDLIASDHAPHHPDEKEVEFDDAPFGISGLETALSAIITYLVNPGHLELQRVIYAMTRAPAKVLGVDKGALRPGWDADITIVDPRVQYRVDTAGFCSKGKNSPLQGRTLTGRVVRTIAGGRAIYPFGGGAGE